MNKCIAVFIKKYIKKAIYNLECANKIDANCKPVDEKIIDELKTLLTEFIVKNDV